MALKGKLTLNDADYAPFELNGVGVFMAFSGNGIYRNHGGCRVVPDNGPKRWAYLAVVLDLFSKKTSGLGHVVLAGQQAYHESTGNGMGNPW